MINKSEKARRGILPMEGSWRCFLQKHCSDEEGITQQHCSRRRMRGGGGEEFYFERECEGKERSHSAGKKEPASPKKNVGGFQKQNLRNSTTRSRRVLD